MLTPRFDFTINLGHVLTIGGLVITMVLGWANFDGRLRAVEKILDTATQTLVEQVRQGARIDALTSRVDRLERMVETRP